MTDEQEIGEVVWQPSKDRIENCELTKFMAFTDHNNYKDLHQWSVKETAMFWQAVWDFSQVIGKTGDIAFVPGKELHLDKFFPKAKLNYTQNVLKGDDTQVAIIASDEKGNERIITVLDLKKDVASFTQALKNAGVKKGDIVAGVVANTQEAIIAMLSTLSLGAIWSSCSPDFGAEAIADRLGQLKPKVIVACSGYSYNNKVYDIREKLSALDKHLSNPYKLIVYSFMVDDCKVEGVQDSQSWDSFVKDFTNSEPEYEQMDFAAPGFILFSSGTTGRPKCIVHSAAGLLLKHLAEHSLQCDIRANDVMLYFTTCGWMMWNWQVSALASKATIVIYDGSPVQSGFDALPKLINKYNVSHFGASAKYFAACDNGGLFDIKVGDKLRTIMSTGSPLLPHSFDYIYEHWGQDIHIASISGGTDICGCFIGGVPTLPVRKGHIQCAFLGCDIASFNDQGQAIENEAGELVCRNSMPSFPVSFLNDDKGLRFFDAYFAKNKGVWSHGDWVSIFADGSLILSGRSDATLNPGGVRIGTAEIYRVVDCLDEIDESLAVGFNNQGDQQIVLFVKLVKDSLLDEKLLDAIKTSLRTQASARHVPSKIFAVTDFPRTRSGKLAELAVRSVVNKTKAVDPQGLANPQVLEQFTMDLN